MAIPRDPNRKAPPIHPGEILREEFMVPMGLSSNALALALRVPTTRISQIIHERRGITADTAYRLATYFGTSADLWMNLQTAFELSTLQHTTLRSIQKEVQRKVA